MDIRKEQLKIFYLAAADDYRAMAETFLRQHFAEACARLGGETVTASIEASLDKGFRYDLEDDEDVLQVLELMYRWGLNFDEDPAYAWVQDYLGDTTLQPETRLDLVVQHFAMLAAPRGR